MDITFINHACFTIKINENLLMFDPWFSGKVFNNSWSLIKETNFDSLELEKLKVIFITHEHPDHLHWDTLKQIRTRTSQKIVIIIPKRQNNNVKKMIEKIGFVALEIPPNKNLSLFKDLVVSNFPTGHDSAYVIKYKDNVLLNQNDCKLNAEQCRNIKNMFPKIDYYFMQFSLAGYYGNIDDNVALEGAKNEHVGMIENYRSFFNPTTTIPFASFVFFCRQENKFLNDYIVNLGELDKSYQLLSYMDQILLDGYEERNVVNINKWNENIRNLKIDDSPFVCEQELLNNINIFFESNDYDSLKCPPKSIFNFYDLDTNLVVDYKNKSAFFNKQGEKGIAKVTTYDLDCFFKFPWGADTMNITSCFEVYEPVIWKNNLIFKDGLYKR